VIGLNEELAARGAAGKPVRIGLIGSGQMGTDVVAQVKMMKGIDVVAAADTRLERARDAFKVGAAEGEVVEVASPEEADKALAAGRRPVATDYRVVTDI
jgi:predicted homoserine dehydrogenase-like protein